MFLRFHLERIFDYLNTPFFLEIWPLPQDLFLKIFRKLVLIYLMFEYYILLYIIYLMPEIRGILVLS
jgi:hypothetical protein